MTSALVFSPFQFMKSKMVKGKLPNGCPSNVLLKPTSTYVAADCSNESVILTSTDSQCFPILSIEN